MLGMSVVGRDVGEIEAFLAASGTETSALVIEGEPGIGKTTLWRATLALAQESGWRVLSCRPGPAEVSLSFAVLGDLLSDLDPAAFDPVPPIQRQAVEAVLLLGPPTSGGVDQRVLGAAVRSVFEHLSHEAPLLVAIDDAQWVDTASRSVLSFVFRRLQGLVKIVATLRTGAEVMESADWISLTRDEAVSRIRLQPLTLGALSTVVSQRLGYSLPRPAMVRVAEMSGGNPFYAIELARTVSRDTRELQEVLPDSLTAVVRARVSGLGDDTKQVLLAAACTADPTLELLAAACELTPAQVVSRLEVAERRGIVEITGGRVYFTHPLLTTGVYASASNPARRAMHKRLADHVDQHELRARHLALAATSADSATMEALDTAAEITGARGAPAAAADLIELAIKLGGDTPSRRLRAADQHFRSGALTQARTHLDHILPDLPDGTLKCVALMVTAAVAGHDDSVAAAVTALTEAVQQARKPGLRLKALLLLPPAESLVGDQSAAVDHAHEAVVLAEAVGVPALRSHALSLWLFMSFLFGMGVDRQALRTALETVDVDSESSSISDAHAVAAVIDAWEGRLEEARPAMESVTQRFIERGKEVDILAAVIFESMINLWLGRLADAETAAADALQRAQAMGGQLFLANALNVVGAAAAHAGRVEDARHAARTAVAAAHGCGSWYLAIHAHTNLGFIETSLGDYAAALDAMTPLLDRFDPEHGTEIIVGGWLPNAVEALCALGRASEAEHLVEALHRNGTRLDRPWMLAVAARGRAMCMAATGDLDGALAQAEQALVHHDRLPMPFERARTLLLLGQLQRRARQKASAASTFAQARTIFDGLGAPLWTARTDTERQRVRVGATTPGTALTATETRVADLAVAGMTNRDIAAQLFISVKTVEAAVSRIYRKLGIRSRAELARRHDPRL